MVVGSVVFRGVVYGGVVVGGVVVGSLAVVGVGHPLKVLGQYLNLMCSYEGFRYKLPT